MIVKWPNGAKIAVLWTFDFDAESVWLARDPERRVSPDALWPAARTAR